MDTSTQIAIADESALFFLLHSDIGNRIRNEQYQDLQLPRALPSGKLANQIDIDHPLLGGRPLTTLVSDNNARRNSGRILCRSCSAPLPEGSLFKMREGLVIATPEFVFARMGCFLDDYKLIQTGINLCGRYFINVETGEIDNRHSFLTTPNKLKEYLESSQGIIGASHAKRTVQWIAPNSGSPEETRVYLQYCLPLRLGGFALPFTQMNYDIENEKLLGLTEQRKYCLDLVNSDLKAGIEYDGDESHQDPWKDIRRRNELGVLGWQIFPIDKSVLYNPIRSMHFGMQMRHYFKLRNRMPKDWDEKFEKLRASIGLPI